MFSNTIEWQYLIKNIPRLLNTIPFTLMVVFISAFFGILLGILVTAVRIRKPLIISQCIQVYVSFTRGTPGIIQLFVVYYGLPVFLRLFGVDINQLSRTAFAILTLVLHNASFASEVFLPTWKSIDKGQHDAADSIGMSSHQKLWRILIPQMVPIALPNLGNLLINLIKDTSLLFTIGIVDLMGQAKTIIASDYGIGKIEIYLIIAAIYWFLTFATERGICGLENHFSRKTSHRRLIRRD